MQSFSRLETEVADLRAVVERLLSAQLPVLSWWALANVLTRTATTLTVLAIIVVGTLLTIKGKATVGEMVTFMNFAGTYHRPVGAQRQFHQQRGIGSTAFA